MLSEVKREVSMQELAKIKKAMKGAKTPRLRKRYEVLYLYLLGMPGKEIVNLTGITASSIYNIYGRYRNDGILGLMSKKIPGRPTRIKQEEQDMLKEVIRKKHPFTVGLSKEFYWNAGLVAKYIRREYGHIYSIRGVTGLLARMGFCYKHPVYVFIGTKRKN